MNFVARLKLLLVFFSSVDCFDKRRSFVIFIDSSKTRAVVGTATVPIQLAFEILILVFKFSCGQQFLVILAAVASAVWVLATHCFSSRSCALLIVLSVSSQ